MKQDLNTIRAYFQTGEIPTQEQYKDVFDSFVHLDDSREEAIVTGYEPIAPVIQFSDRFPEEGFEFLNAETAIGGKYLEVLAASRGFNVEINAGVSPIIMTLTKDTDVTDTFAYVEYVVTKTIEETNIIMQTYRVLLSEHNG